MKEYYVFSDASFDPKTKKGVICYLILNQLENNKNFDSDIITKKVNGENIARLEFISCLEALNSSEIPTSSKIHLVIDCKAIENLLGRRENLERNKYLSQSKGQILANADLYKSFFKVMDKLSVNIVWVKGHSPKSEHSTLEAIFSQVDKKARKLLRELT